MPSDAPPDLITFGANIRSLIEHEDNLINHRMQWMVLLQGLLFAALGTSLGNDGTLPIAFVLIALGLFVSVTSYVSVKYTNLALERLTSLWYARVEESGIDESRAPQVMGLHHRNPGKAKPPHPFWLPRNSLPWAFGVAWTLIAAVLTYQAITAG